MNDSFALASGRDSFVVDDQKFEIHPMEYVFHLLHARTKLTSSHQIMRRRDAGLVGRREGAVQNRDC